MFGDLPIIRCFHNIILLDRKINLIFDRTLRKPRIMFKLCLGTASSKRKRFMKNSKARSFFSTFFLHKGTPLANTPFDASVLEKRKISPLGKVSFPWAPQPIAK